MKKNGPMQLRWLLLSLAVIALLIVIVLMIRRTGAPSGGAIATAKLPASTNALPATPSNNVSNSPVAGTGVLSNSPDFQERPFPVAYESDKNQWALADGRDPNVIRQLAHNELEYQRMVEENPRIFKRQLVYLKETAAAVFEQAKLAGEPVRQLTLPGVDGQELQFEIVKSQGGDSSRLGMFNGHLAGDNDSLVTLAFMDGRQAYTVISPKEKIFVVGEPREDGQVIVKAIDPETYGVGPLVNCVIQPPATNK